jgi:hypothetical protein
MIDSKPSGFVVAIIRGAGGSKVIREQLTAESKIRFRVDAPGEYILALDLSQAPAEQKQALKRV